MVNRLLDEKRASEPVSTYFDYHFQSTGGRMSSDRIEKSVVLRVPRERAWEAFSTAKAFGEWFGVKLQGTFKPGVRLNGKVTQRGYEDYPFELAMDRIEQERLFSYRWHPGATERGKDYSGQPTTLVEFRLDDAPGGTRLTLVESGFDALDPEYRRRAYEENEKGWVMQMESVQRYLEKAA
jgi:uncharacterized protein YndB with AHSA1/START domain